MEHRNTGYDNDGDPIFINVFDGMPEEYSDPPAEPQGIVSMLKPNDDRASYLLEGIKKICHHEKAKASFVEACSHCGQAARRACELYYDDSVASGGILTYKLNTRPNNPGASKKRCNISNVLEHPDIDSSVVPCAKMMEGVRATKAYIKESDTVTLEGSSGPRTGIQKDIPRADPWRYGCYYDGQMAASGDEKPA